MEIRRRLRRRHGIPVRWRHHLGRGRVCDVDRRHDLDAVFVEHVLDIGVQPGVELVQVGDVVAVGVDLVVDGVVPQRLLQHERRRLPLQALGARRDLLDGEVVDQRQLIGERMTQIDVVIDQQHARARRHGVSVHLNPVRAIFKRIVDPHGIARQFGRFAEH